MAGISDAYPPFGLSLSCGPVELRHLSLEDIPHVATIAASGIHTSTEVMPFLDAWHEAPAEELPRNLARKYFGKWAATTPENWSLMFGVWRDGMLIGIQEMFTRYDFRQTRSLATSSWLGIFAQGRGTGTLMRQMVGVLAFDHLGAQELTSGYVEGNHASAAVSRKVGYRDNGTLRLPRGDGFWMENRVSLVPEDFVRPPYEVHVEGIDAVRRFLDIEEAAPVVGLTPNVDEMLDNVVALPGVELNESVGS